MSPFHRVGLGVISWCKGESDTGSLKSLPHCLRPEVRGVVGVDLQGLTKTCVKSLEGPDYLFTGRVAEGVWPRTTC